MASQVTVTDRHASFLDDTPHQQFSPEAISLQRQDSLKRKSSEAAGPESDKKKRRKVNHACVYCRRSHMTCDLERPCARCIKRDIGHLCHDEPRDPPKRSKSEIGMAEIAPAPEEGRGDVAGLENGQVDGGMPYAAPSNVDMTGLNGTADPTLVLSGQQMAQPKPLSPVQLQRQQTAPNNLGVVDNHNNQAMLSQNQNFDWNNASLQNQFQDMHHLHPNYMFNTSEVSNEYNLLNDFLSSSLLDDGGLYSTDDVQTLFNDPLLATSSMSSLTNPNFSFTPTTNQSSNNQASNNQHQQQQQPPNNLPPTLQPPTQNAKAAEEISRPSSAFPLSDTKARDKFYLVAADPAGLASAGDRLHKLLKAKYDAGMLKPFNYVKGYARLQSYMSRHLQPSSQRRILEQLGRFRPKFREAMQCLTDMQLVLVEMWFERSLMEYDRVFASMAIPACCWRRTGEIFRGNREMAELIGVGMERLRDGKLALHEVLEEESLVSYWEKFGAIAFDQSQKAILTSCTLKTPGPEPGEDGKVTAATAPAAAVDGVEQKAVVERVRCCFSFTIRRDNHNM